VSNDYYLDPRLANAYDADMGAAADAMDDLPFYLQLARQAAAAGHAVLELGCGTGRITLPIAREGIEIVGLDNAPAMLDVARRKAAAEELELPWVEADMRDFRLDRRFGLVIVPYRSFLHLLTPEDQASCLATVRQHLLPGGRLALNFFVPPITATSGQGAPVISRLNKGMRLRHVSRDEMAALLHAAGLEVEALYGGFAGEPFTSSSGEMVWLAKQAVSHAELS